MKTYIFRATQTLQAYYNLEVSIEASSEKAARNKLNKMSTREIEEISDNWTQETDGAEGIGPITIQELITEDDK